VTDVRDSTRLRIGMVAPPWYGLPPSGHGGIEDIWCTGWSGDPGRPKPRGSRPCRSPRAASSKNGATSTSEHVPCWDPTPTGSGRLTASTSRTCWRGLGACCSRSNGTIGSPAGPPVRQVVGIHHGHWLTSGLGANRLLAGAGSSTLAWSRYGVCGLGEAAAPAECVPRVYRAERMPALCHRLAALRH
jgi:hypothetical protein